MTVVRAGSTELAGTAATPAASEALGALRLSKKPPLLPGSSWRPPRRSSTTATTEAPSEPECDQSKPDGDGDVGLDEPEGGDAQAEAKPAKGPSFAITHNRLIFHAQMLSAAGSAAISGHCEGHLASLRCRAPKTHRSRG
ncbi:unnamed protein product [Prorocentrum cordatum]|uniref:Uncharacterized protein n=1 Tax=Prorocentrum cordatum TaxID=2364126 RepID=A0ABN9SIR1_9DINO|nr:unnamed protein product [Polarella glacialis]